MRHPHSSMLGPIGDHALVARNLEPVLEPSPAERPSVCLTDGDVEQAIMACCERIRAMAWGLARSCSDANADDLYSIGMVKVCETAAAGYLARAIDPVAYLCGAAKFAMLAELARLHDHSCSSLDQPLSDESSATLHDLLAAAPARADRVFSTREWALYDALLRLKSPKQRAVLRRRFGLTGYGPFSLKETARELQSTVDGVKVFRKRALANLRSDPRLRKAMGLETLS